LVSRTTGFLWANSREVRRFQAVLRQVKSGEKLNLYTESSTDLDANEIIRAKLTVNQKDKVFTQNPDLNVPESKFGELLVRSRHVPAAKQRATEDIFQFLSGQIGGSTFDAMLEEGDGPIEIVRTKILGEECEGVCFDCASGKVSLFFAKSTGAIQRYSVEIARPEEFWKGASSRSESTEVRPVDSTWREIELRQTTVTKFPDGTSAEYIASHKIKVLDEQVNPESVMPDCKIVIPNGHTVEMDFRPQLKAFWEDGKVKLRYNKKGIENFKGAEFNFESTPTRWIQPVGFVIFGIVIVVATLKLK
jgi:hypothetical protein